MKVTRKQLKTLKDNGVEKEDCRKCGNKYYYFNEFDQKELCGADLCYSCVAMRYHNPMILIHMPIESCKECKQLYTLYPVPYKKYETGNTCPNCSCLKYLLKTLIHNNESTTTTEDTSNEKDNCC